MMAYQVDRFNGQFLVSVGDATIDTTTDLRLVGKNYAGYGELQNENFVFLLENFANITPPTKAISGQIWYDSDKKRLRFFDGTRFKVAGGAEVSPTGPANLSVGEFWWNSDSKQLYTWTGSEFELIGPAVSPDLGQSIISSASVKDIFGNDFIILKVIVDDQTVAVMSKDSFDLDSSVNAIPNFTRIKKGITLAGANNETGVTSNEFFFWGTAANASRLGGVPAAEYVRRGNITFGDDVRFSNAGFTVGDDSNFRTFIEQSNAVLENQVGNSIIFRITDGSFVNNVAVIDNTGIYPLVSNTYELGKENSNIWKRIFADTIKASDFVGSLTGPTFGDHTGTVRAVDNSVLINATTKEIGGDNVRIVGSFEGTFQGTLIGTADNATQLTGVIPSTSATENTVALRDSSGNVLANQFIGISQQSERLRINNNASDSVWSGGDSTTQYRSAKTISEAFTIAARDINSDIFARLFQGTATSARYADLAEKYLADQQYDVGTVVVVGGSAEVTASSAGQKAIGVVSENPAFMMNAELIGGTYIALKGRVSVQVTGPVEKGNYLVAHDNGAAIASKIESTTTFAIALETNSSCDLKIIEAVVL